MAGLCSYYYCFFPAARQAAGRDRLIDPQAAAAAVAKGVTGHADGERILYSHVKIREQLSMEKKSNADCKGQNYVNKQTSTY